MPTVVMTDELTLPDESELGPAMRALTAKQRRYVVALAHTGGKGSEAARLAGVPDSAARVYAYECRQNPKVQDAIREWVHGMMHIGAVIGAKALIEIAQDINHKDRMKAADRLMERAGMIVVQKQEVHVVKSDSLAEIVREIRQDAQKMGLDARVLLKQAGVPEEIIDAEFEVIDTRKRIAAPDTEERIEDPLEDLLR